METNCNRGKLGPSLITMHRTLQCILLGALFFAQVASTHAQGMPIVARLDGLDSSITIGSAQTGGAVATTGATCELTLQDADAAALGNLLMRRVHATITITADIAGATLFVVLDTGESLRISAFDARRFAGNVVLSEAWGRGWANAFWEVIEDGSGPRSRLQYLWTSQQGRYGAILQGDLATGTWVFQGQLNPDDAHVIGSHLLVALSRGFPATLRAQEGWGSSLRFTVVQVTDQSSSAGFANGRVLAVAAGAVQGQPGGRRPR